MKRFLSAAVLFALTASASVFAAVDPNVPITVITPITPATPVPEAETVALALAGLGVVVFAAVRRAKKKK